MDGNCERCKKRVYSTSVDDDLHHVELTIYSYYYCEQKKELKLCDSCLDEITQRWLTLVGLAETKKGKQ